MTNVLITLLTTSVLQGAEVEQVKECCDCGSSIAMMDVKKKKKKGKKIGGSKGKKSKKGFFSKIFGSK
tara:strand:+ start:528 stop:731 length:204 start_codon:yes stop_codon:yes gene_type:complete